MRVRKLNKNKNANSMLLHIAGARFGFLFIFIVHCKHCFETKQSCSFFSLLKFQGFENHVKTEHYQWAYLFFFIHLTETRPNDFSALELYVYNLLDRNIYDFFPLNRALSLQNEEDSNERKVEILRVQVDYMVNKMREEVIDNFIL